jgi:hypothetical protein
MGKQTLVVVCATFIAAPLSGAIAKDCFRPQKNVEILDGTHDGDPYAFDFISYLWNNPASFFEFGRCVHNRNENPLWIDWRKLGVKGTAKKDGNVSQYFPQKTDDKHTDKSELYFGARPEKIDADAIFRPDETALLLPTAKLWRAEELSEPDLSLALQSKSDFENELVKLSKINDHNVFEVISLVHFALPQNEDAFVAMMDGKGSDDRFYDVTLAVGQTFQLSGDKVLITPIFQVTVPEEQRGIAKEGNPINFSVSDTPDIFSMIYPKFVETTQLYAGQLDFNPERSGFSIGFPVFLQTATVNISFDKYAEFSLPIISVSSDLLK